MEEAHWWFCARRDLILRLLRKLQVKSGDRILDIACSGGALLASLATSGFTQVTGVDISEAAITRCHARGLSNVKLMDAATPAFADESFDVLIASDILEHLEHPGPALENWRRLLKPEGILLVFVPAFMWLWSGHDEMNHHFRRYTRGGLIQELRIADFTVDTSGYWNTALFPAIAGVRLIRRAITASAPGVDPLRLPPPLVNRLLARWMRVENTLLTAGVRMPIGVSTWAVATRS